MPLSRKLVGLALTCVIGLSPTLALACAGPTMQNCHPCCAPQSSPRFAAAASGSMPVSPCCTVSSDEQSPKTESQVTVGTLGTARVLTVAATLQSPSRHMAANEDRDS